MFHLLFAIAVVFLTLPPYEVYKRYRVRNEKFGADNRNALMVVISSVSFGIFLLFASIPGAFFEQPHWFVDKLYWVVERVVDVFT